MTHLLIVYVKQKTPWITASYENWVITWATNM